MTLFLWIAGADPGERDVHAGFRTRFDLPAAGLVEIDLVGASWLAARVDDRFVGEGPSRFPSAFPQYQTHRLRLAAGRHVLSVHVHHFGVPTRLMDNPPPFLWARVRMGERELPLAWKAARLPGFVATGRRINGQLGWAEWCDTRALPRWEEPDFDDRAWPAAVAVSPPLGTPAPLDAAVPYATALPLHPLATGTLAETFGYENDNPCARFYLRDLAPRHVPAQGLWRRYDLGRVRLFRPQVTLDLPAGAVVEMVSNEALAQGRVPPWVTLSASDSSTLDHFVARGGVQTFAPLQPKGGRYLEVHVLAPPERIRFVREEAIERGYYGPAVGALATGDWLLDRIWRVGVETHRACAEDAVTDNPTRERGQWAGDVVSVGLDIAAAAFSDLRLLRRGLIQCAQCARDDGLVSGMCPGQNIFLSTYAAQWVSAAVRYVEVTGETALLETLLPAAESNIAAFEAHRAPEGVRDELAWAFVDWGYVRNPGPSDMGLNLHYLAALRDLVRWCQLLSRLDRAAHYQRLTDEVRATIGRYFAAERGAWARIGFHRAALGLAQGFFAGADSRACRAALKAHFSRCFPNDKNAPRLSDPSAASPRLITPYFAHFALPALFERGDADFALAQFRSCWGWALTIESGTWLEVFDPRWSHCHQWSGCPTWLMSRYLLGLRPRFDRGVGHFDFALQPGSLRGARGRIPLPDGGAITVDWERTGAGRRYRLSTPTPIALRFPDGRTESIARRFETTLPDRRYP